MILLKMAVLLVASLAAADAAGQKDAAAVSAASAATVNTDKPDKPDKPRKPAVKRRAVQQIVDGMPAYGPRLNAPPALPVHPQSAPSALPSLLGAPPSPSLSPSQASPAGVAPPPAAIGHCDAGGCTDVNGTRYNGAAGSTVIGPQGRSCTSNGGVLQCF